MRTYSYASVTFTNNLSRRRLLVGAVVQLVEYRTRNQEVASSTHTRSTASNHEQVANLLCARANSARALILSYASGLTQRHLTESATLTLTFSTSLILTLTHAMR